MLNTTFEAFINGEESLGGVFRAPTTEYSTEDSAENGRKGQTRSLVLTRAVGGKDVSRRGAFPESFGSLRLTLRAARRLGILRVLLLLRQDGGEDREIPFRYEPDGTASELYSLTLSEKDFYGAGLYYWSLVFDFGAVTLCSQSVNNVDFTVGTSPEPFRFLLYRDDFSTPEWFCGNIMYHIFVDRFCRGSRAVPLREEAVLHADWHMEMPEYGAYPGAFVKNNDFFGGTLYGVAEKLDYLESLGVGCIYLSPVFSAYSNHKYDTADYETVDEMFGGDAALSELITAADKKGIRIILDGVFNHTGDNSRYFDRYGKYGGGAYGSKSSEYTDWFCFENEERTAYKSWWGIKILPKLDLNRKSCADYFTGENGIVRRYLQKGISGWRLDVADELPSAFLDSLRSAAKQEKKDALIIGEVWENAADKVAYGERRKYFLGGQLDSVMNYPVKNAIISFVRDGDAEALYDTLTDLWSSYPPFVCDVLMNILGTHDTERILTVLAGDTDSGLSNKELSEKRMTGEQRELGIKRLKLASVLQYTVFGSPSVFYGDEAGLEGYHDPFCRMPYPWGKEDKELLSHYRLLGKIRREEKTFAHGSYSPLAKGNGFFAFLRQDENGEIVVAVNGGAERQTFALSGSFRELLSGKNVRGEDGISAEPLSALILKRIGRKSEKSGQPDGKAEEQQSIQDITT